MTTLRCVIHHGELETSTPADWLVCLKCSNRVLKHLRELEELLPTLSLERSPAGGEPVSGPGFGSRSPANDDVLVHTDPRSDVTAYNPETGLYWLACGCLVGDGCEHQRGLSALGTIASWAQLVSEDLKIKIPAHWMAQADLLRREHSWIVRQPWVDEYSDALRQVHAAVRQLAHDPVPRSQGKCIRWNRNVECKGDVYELDDASGVRCSRCQAIYTGLDLDRLRVAQETG